MEEIEFILDSTRESMNKLMKQLEIAFLRFVQEKHHHKCWIMVIIMEL